MPHLDRRWRRRQNSYATIVSQARLLYNFSIGYELTGDEQYLGAVEKGARALLDLLRDREHGGWFWSCTADGTVLDPTKDSYGHAFVIFGLAHACRCTRDREYAQAALDAWEVVSTRLMDRRGGLVRRMSREFATNLDAGVRSQNPVMHLFEALLALGDVPGHSDMYVEAERVADFVLSRLVCQDDGALPEVYDESWQELSGDSGGHVVIGHQFEWAYLLSAAVERGLPRSYLAYALDLLEYGLRVGYDCKEGGVWSTASPDGQITSREKGWWEQCEAARALIHFVLRRGRPGLQMPLHGTIDYVNGHLIDDEYGGWYAGEKALASGDRSKGSHWKVDYHVVGMCVEAIRLAAKNDGSSQVRFA
jgi:mannose/cellobiose epimerase-like protein (N-acyl-D-glucosamine 2-epimerase family)